MKTSIFTESIDEIIIYSFIKTAMFLMLLLSLSFTRLLVVYYSTTSDKNKAIHEIRVLFLKNKTYGPQ